MALSTEGVDVPELVIQHVTVSVRASVTGHSLHCPHVAPQPEDVCLLGRKGFVLAADNGTSFVDGFAHFHGKRLAGALGQMLSK